MKFFKATAPTPKDFIKACRQGALGTVQAIIAAGIDINAGDNYGDDGLSIAAFHGHYEIVSFLLTKPQLSSHLKDLALVLACQAGYENIVDILLKNGANINVYFEDYHTPLFQAITNNKLAVFDRLLKNNNIQIELEDEQGAIPLHVAAFNGKLDMCKRLIASGANYNLKNKEDLTACDYAKQQQKTDVVEYIEKIKLLQPCFTRPTNNLPLEPQNISQIVMQYL